jgi:hypothetical protein
MQTVSGQLVKLYLGRAALASADRRVIDASGVKELRKHLAY